MADPGSGRVLVVDDSEDDHLQIQRALRDEVQVIAAYTGAEALERLERETFDALITDQKMPRMSGDELIRRIKSAPATQALRCILLSGRTSDPQLVEILREGRVFHYFEKNKTLLTADGRADLLMAVRNAVQASRLEREGARLTRRLRAQVDAVSSQYRLLRNLVNQKDPSLILRLVIESLAERVQCRAAFGLIDLRPAQPAFVQHALRGDARPLGSQEVAAWRGYLLAAYGRMSGRSTSEGVVSRQPTGPLDLRGLQVAAAGAEAPQLPVFLNRDLRGLLVLVRDGQRPLEPEEEELLEIWRDQLQDALTRVHTRLLDEHRLIELMVETMNEGVILTDAEGTVSLMNPAARRILGLQDSERPDFTVVVGALGLSSLDVLRQLGLGESKVAWRELQVGEAYYHVLFSHVLDNAGAVVGVLTVIRDVSEQKQAEHRREEFVHIIGHELRSPLTSIGGVLDLLGKQVLGELSDRQREYVGMAKDSCVKINHILDDLLDLAKFEKGKMPLTLETVNLEQVILDAARKFEAVAIDHDVRLDFECELEGLFCQADAPRLTQVVNNLLSNALKYTPAGGRVAVSVFTTFTAPELYLVKVHNTGEEIAEADLDRVFDKFEQVAMHDRRSIGGTGLGLSICRNIVRGHGGDIWAESGRGEGTTFVFSLPGERVTSTLRTVEITAPVEPELGPGSRGTLLLVCADDHESLGLKAILTRLGFLVRLCRQDVAAVRLRIAQTRPAAAILLDVYGQPDEEIVAELASHQQLPVVGVLPVGTPAPALLDTVVEVPPDPLVLASTLSVVLSRRRDRRRLRVLLLEPHAGRAVDLADRLEKAGYLAYGARPGQDVVRRAETLLPDLLVVDAAWPGIDDALGRVRGEAGADLPVVLLGDTATARRLGVPLHAVLPREAGTRELLLALRSALVHDRRRGIDTLAVLPGARELQREVQGRIRDGLTYAYCAIDIHGLGEAVERHGFMWGHGAMVHTAELIHQVLRDHADPRAVLGHQRDDDFVIIVRPEDCELVCSEICRAFERVEPLIAGLAAGEGRLRLVITAVVDENRRFDRFSALQAELSRRRAREAGDVVLIDRGN